MSSSKIPQISDLQEAVSTHKIEMKEIEDRLTEENRKDITKKNVKILRKVLLNNFDRGFTDTRYNKVLFAECLLITRFEG
jgi:hypothetical protein